MSAHMLNLVDLFIICIIGISVIISLIRGFVKEALSLAGWIIAAWVAVVYTKAFAEVLTPYIAHPTMRMLVAFISLFLVTLIITSLLNFLISQLVKRTGLSGTDRLLGIIFGLARGTLLVALLLVLGQMTPLPEENAWKQSMLVPVFQPIETWIMRFLPDKVTNKLAESSSPFQVNVNGGE